MENKQLLNEGLDYLNKLHKMDPKTPKLGAEVLYNFISIGIESVLTAVLMDNNRMVDHSGITQLLRELEKIEPINPEWMATARMMNRFQSYCSLEPIPVKNPNPEELNKIVDFALSVEEYAKKIELQS